jgi:hypothetical protein
MFHVKLRFLSSDAPPHVLFEALRIPEEQGGLTCARVARIQVLHGAHSQTNG